MKFNSQTCITKEQSKRLLASEFAHSFVEKMKENV